LASTREGIIVSSPRPVRVRGPSAPFAVGFEEHLAGQGYRSASDHLYVMAQLSDWMDSEKRAVGDLSASGVDDLVGWRGACGYVSAVSPARMCLVVDYVVGLGVVARFEPAVAGTPVEIHIERYWCYLLGERAFQADSVRVYVEVARLFLSWLSTGGVLTWRRVTRGGGDPACAGRISAVEDRFGQGDGYQAAVTAAVLVRAGPHGESAGRRGGFGGELASGPPAKSASPVTGRLPAQKLRPADHGSAGGTSRW